MSRARSSRSTKKSTKTKNNLRLPQKRKPGITVGLFFILPNIIGSGELTRQPLKQGHCDKTYNHTSSPTFPLRFFISLCHQKKHSYNEETLHTLLRISCLLLRRESPGHELFKMAGAWQGVGRYSREQPSKIPNRP